MVAKNELAGLIKSLTWIFDQQNEDGGWSIKKNLYSDPEITGHVTFVLINGVRYSLKSHRKSFIMD